MAIEYTRKKRSPLARLYAVNLMQGALKREYPLLWDSRLKNPNFGAGLLDFLDFLHIVIPITWGLSKTNQIVFFLIVRVSEHLPQKSILILQ